jgi:hypothetical protein
MEHPADDSPTTTPSVEEMAQVGQAPLLTEQQLRALAGPAFVRFGDRAMPTGARLGLDLLAAEICAALGEVLRRPVGLRLLALGSDDAPGGAGTDRSSVAFNVVFKHPSLAGGEAALTFSLPAARALVDPLAADLADACGDGELAGPDCGLLEYVALATADRLFRAMPTWAEGFAFVAIGEPSTLATAHVAPPAFVDFEISVSGRGGIVRLACQGWEARGMQTSDLPPSLPAPARKPPTLELEVGLPVIRLSAEEYGAIQLRDILLLGRTTLKSFASNCALLTTTGWSIGAVEWVSDSATLVSVRVGSLRPEVRPELLGDGDQNTVVLRPAMGKLSLTTEQLARWRPGDVVDLPVDPVLPVGLYRGMTKVGSGELVVVEGELGIRLGDFNPHRK